MTFIPSNFGSMSLCPIKELMFVSIVLTNCFMLKTSFGFSHAFAVCTVSIIFDFGLNPKYFGRWKQVSWKVFTNNISTLSLQIFSTLFKKAWILSISSFNIMVYSFVFSKYFSNLKNISFVVNMVTFDFFVLQILHKV